MVLLAAAVCSKAGKAIISRQFVEMSKARIEGLLAAFPKLLSSGKQHTFVETESVRYVYQPMDKLYMLLITTKASNILEDLETLRLFSRVILEYCKAVEESEIVDNAFNLIFAFDEIIALGYRESVNLAQIRTFVEMDSHEEKVYQAVRQTQEREAKNKMREKAKELQRAKQDAAKRGLKSPTGYGSSSYGSGSGGGYTPTSPISDSSPTEPIKSSYSAPSKAPVTGKAMKLRSGNKDVDSFVDQLKSEGVQIISNTDGIKSSGPVSSKATTPVDTEVVHIRVEEKLSLTARRDGGVQDMELHGIISLRITDDTYGRIKIHVENQDDKGIQIQTHPNIDRELFRSQQVVALKNPSKPFPLHSEVGVLKWRFQTSDSALMPLSINCWPSESGSNKCDVNIEYELQIEKMELEDVSICIPLASDSGSPVVSDCDGEYHYDSRKHLLEWRIPVIDASNKTGSMEFSCSGHPNDFFPVTLNFISSKPYSDLRILGLAMIDDGAPVKHSMESVLRVEKYEVV